MTKTPPTNQQIVDLLKQIAAVYSVIDKAPFRTRAYQNAADAVESLSQPLYSIWQEKPDLTKLSGIGSGIAKKLVEWFETGKPSQFEEIKSEVPSGMFALIPIPGIGPKIAYKLSLEFKLTSFDQALKQVTKHAQAGDIAKLEGFGEKKQAEILRAIKDFNPDSEKRIRLDEALAISQQIIDYISQSSHVDQVSSLGSLRRYKSSIGDIDLAVATTNPKSIQKHLQNYPQVQKLIASGEGLVRFIHQTGINVDVKITDPAEWGSLLQHFTGSKAHNVHLREIALKKGLSLSDHGIKHQSKLKTFKSEQEFYKAINMQWIPPEIREDQGEIELAQQNKLPQLITLKDLKGDFHTHTSDDTFTSSHDYGANTIQELIKAAQKKGYHYIAIGDHNPSLSNHTPDEVIRLIKKRVEKILKHQNKASEKTVKQSTIKVLTTLEVDIRPDGKLALPDKAANHLDFLIASIHSSFNQPKEKITQRLITAIKHPKVKIIGHPTGRIINQRPGYQLDWDKLFKACKEFNTALEVNANPSRLDIDETLIKQAIDRGVLISINTDAHHIDHLDFMHFGVHTARRGWAQPQHVLNTFSYKQLQSWLKT